MASYTSGSMATVQSAGTLVKTGSTFTGWNTAAGGTGTPYAAGATFTITTNTTLYAQWTTSTPSTTYTVTYDPNGGTGTVPADATAYTSGSTVMVLASPAPTRSGYTFGGWSLSAGGTAVTMFTMPASNTTLYAQWTTSTTITLGTPVPVWTGSTDPKTLTWPEITNATAYLVSTCTSNNDNSLTACIPTGSSSNTTRTLSPAPGSKDTICYSVVATGTSPYTTSSASSVKCIHQKTGDYTYQN